MKELKKANVLCDDLNTVHNAFRDVKSRREINNRFINTTVKMSQMNSKGKIEGEFVIVQ